MISLHKQESPISTSMVNTIYNKRYKWARYHSVYHPEEVIHHWRKFNCKQYHNITKLSSPVKWVDTRIDSLCFRNPNFDYASEAKYHYFNTLPDVTMINAYNDKLYSGLSLKLKDCTLPYTVYISPPSQYPGGGSGYTNFRFDVWYLGGSIQKLNTNVENAGTNIVHTYSEDNYSNAPQLTPRIQARGLFKILQSGFRANIEGIYIQRYSDVEYVKIISESKWYAVGAYIEEVTDTTKKYPEDGRYAADGFYYSNYRKEVIPAFYSKGEFMDEVSASREDEYPTNGRHTDGYWYVKI